MTLLEIVILGLVLSLDAFAITISIVLCTNKIKRLLVYRFLIITALLHIIMPLIGYTLANLSYGIPESYNNWITFIVLSILGGKIIFESIENIKSNCDDCSDNQFNLLSLKSTIITALAVSIDAMTAGFSMGLQKINIINYSKFTNIFFASILIGICAFIVPLIGFKIGKKVNHTLGNKAGIVGGIVLILIALKTLII